MLLFLLGIHGNWKFDKKAVDIFCIFYYNTYCLINNGYQIIAKYRSVAQLGRALRSGRRGRGFESRRFDYNKIPQSLIRQALRYFLLCKKFCVLIRYVKPCLIRRMVTF